MSRLWRVDSDVAVDHDCASSYGNDLRALEHRQEARGVAGRPTTFRPLQAVRNAVVRGFGGHPLPGG